MKPQSLHAHEDRLLDFVYGELPAPEAQVVEAHLQGCARCTQALDDIRGVRATMSHLSAEEPAPDAGLESLMAYAQQAARRAAAGPAPKPSRWRRWLLPVLGLASVSTFGILTLQSESSAPVLGPDLSQAKLERSASEDAAPAPVAAQAIPPPSASPADADVPKQPPQAELVEAPRRAEGWEDSGSGGGLDPRVSRGAESKRKREVPKAKADFADRASSGPPSKKGLAMKSAPSASTRQDEESYAEARKPAPSPEPERGSLKLGGTSMAGRAAADDAPPAEAEAGMAMPAPSGAVAQAPAAAAADMDLANEVAKEAAPRPAPAKTATRTKKPESLSAYTVAPAAPPPPPMTQAAPAPEPAPSPAALSRQAQEAYRAGDRDREARLLRQALDAGASGAERLGLLNRLCEAELSRGRRAAGLEACNQVLSEAPGSSAAQAARRRLARESVNLEAPAKSAAPAK